MIDKSMLAGFFIPLFVFLAPVLGLYYLSLEPSADAVPKSITCPLCGRQAKLKNYSAYSGAAYWCEERHYSSYEYFMGYWRLRYAD